MSVSKGNKKTGAGKRIGISVLIGVAATIFLTITVSALENAAKVSVQGRAIWPALIRGTAVVLGCMLCAWKGGGVREIVLCAVVYFSALCLVTLFCYKSGFAGIPGGAASVGGGMLITIILNLVAKMGKKKKYKRGAYC